MPHVIARSHLVQEPPHAARPDRDQLARGRGLVGGRVRAVDSRARAAARGVADVVRVRRIPAAARGRHRGAGAAVARSRLEAGEATLRVEQDFESPHLVEEEEEEEDVPYRSL